MEHSEALFLMHSAHIIAGCIEKAEKENEFFHVSDTFVPLKNGLFAQAQIRKINPTDTNKALILRIRSKKDEPDELIDKEAFLFFTSVFSKLPQKIKGKDFFEWVFFSKDTPENKTPSAHKI